MGYKHISIIRFDNLSDTGIDTLPEGSIIQQGTNLYVLEDNAGLTGATTLSTAISNDNVVKRVDPTDYASSVTGGTVKMRLNGTTLYIRNDGSNA